MNTNQKQSQELSELRTQVSALSGRLDSQDHTLAELRDLVTTLRQNPAAAPSLAIPELLTTQYHMSGSQKHGNMHIATFSRPVGAGVHVVNVVVVGGAMGTTSTFIPGGKCDKGEVK